MESYERINYQGRIFVLFNLWTSYGLRMYGISSESL